jgi:hypothetical protein
LLRHDLTKPTPKGSLLRDVEGPRSERAQAPVQGRQIERPRRGSGFVRLLVCLRALGSDIEIKVKRPPVNQPSEADEAEKHKGRMSLMVA